MPDDGALALRQALEEADRLRRENATLTAQHQERTTQLFGEAGARISAQDSAIDGQIAAAEAAHTSNQREWERLQAEGDFKGAAEAMSRMIQASTAMVSLKNQKDQLAVQRATLDHNQHSQPQTGNGGGSGSPQTELTAGMSEREREWVSQHPSYLTDERYRSKAASAAGYAINVLNYPRDSQQYFDHIAAAVGDGPAMSIGADNLPDDTGSPDVTVPRMPTPQQPRPVSVDPNDPGMQSAMQMVDEMYPQSRAVGNGGAGIRSIAAPPVNRVRELARQHQRGRAIEPTLEELETARILIPDVLGAEGAAMSDEDKIRTYYAWYNAPSSQRKLRRWYGRDAA